MSRCKLPDAFEVLGIKRRKVPSASEELLPDFNRDTVSNGDKRGGGGEEKGKRGKEG